MSDRARPRIYFLHGLLATSYAHFGEQLVRWRESHDVVPIDLPGHGRSRLDAAAPYYARCEALLRRYLDERGPGHVLGVSYLGATVALRTTLADPTGVQSLVLSGYVPNAPHAVVTRWTHSFHLLAERDPELVRHYERVHGPRWRQTLDCVLAEIRESYPASVAVSDAQLAELAVPTLVLNGSYKSDERETAARLPSLGPQIEAGILPGAGHIPSHDQPELFSGIVEAFWARLQQSSVARPRIRDLVPRDEVADARAPGGLR
ncbi:MAG: alpha/beta fold hydrolase [Myxococcales bacterium]|nr:alpha/beta fold hydrolase [Myxococcales bacterium]